MLCSSCQEKINTWLNERKKAEDNQIVVNFLATVSVHLCYRYFKTEMLNNFYNYLTSN